ncbi:MAG: hypothetical protein PVF58_10320 [Candidatus Methanofastidiosia archaeon]|jgi:hypothetical protein
MGKKYLIYVDILGFDELAKDIGGKKDIEEREVRSKFIDVIEERIEIIKAKGGIIGKHYGESDDWLLVTDDLDKIFWIISEILDHNTRYIGYEKIPLEVGIGTAEFDKWAKFDGKDLIIENETIKFLKTYILSYYHKWYKKNKAKRIKSTFVVLTEESFKDLEPLDKKYCKRISYKEKAFFVMNLRRIHQRYKMFRFLEKIGYPGSKLYDRINEVYVLPLEYDDIEKTLDIERIVFITGTREYGKTYTAVRFLWNYHNSGYEPRWIKGAESSDRIRAREILEEIDRELRPKHIIYFEDPFGKTKYEKRESLERGTGAIIDAVKRVKDSYVIITSREEVFKEFKEEELSEDDIEEFERRLNLKKPSYNYEGRKMILEEWARKEGCKWLENNILISSILGHMKDENVLPTPLSIKDFVWATVDIGEIWELEKIMKKKSEETAKAFSKEIESMTDDKILFLSFLFISNRLEDQLIRNTYAELVKQMNLRNAWDFDRIFDWFKDDKIKIGDYIEFSHPSYSEALKYLLVKNGYVTPINKRVFSQVLNKLSEKDEAAGGVAQIAEVHFDKLPEDIRNELLLKLSEKDEAAGGVARIIAIHFDELSERIRNLLFEFCEKDEAAEDVVQAVAIQFFKFSVDAIYQLLLKLSEKDEAAGGVARIIAIHFDELPERIRNELLLKLSEKDEAAGGVARIIAKHFDELPERIRNLLFELSKRDKAAGGVAQAIALSFGRLPENLKNLLFELSKRDKAAGGVAQAITHSFDELPEDIRNELLLKLSEKDEASRYVLLTLRVHFDKLPEDIRNELLLKLSEKDEASRYVLLTLREYFDELSERIRNELLLKLSEKDEAAGGVARIIAIHFDELPEDMRDLFGRLHVQFQQAIRDLSKSSLPRNRKEAQILMSILNSGNFL